MNDVALSVPGLFKKSVLYFSKRRGDMTPPLPTKYPINVSHTSQKEKADIRKDLLYR